MANGCNLWGPKDVPGVNCCNQHDHDYSHQDVKKFVADWRLAECIYCTRANKVMGAVMATVMWFFVTVFGWPLWLYYSFRK